MRKNRKVRKVLYTLRTMVARGLNKLKNSRRPAIRYDKTAESCLGVACIRPWLRH